MANSSLNLVSIVAVNLANLVDVFYYFVRTEQ